MNRVPYSLRPLVALATRALSGAEEFGEAINLFHNSAANFAPVLHELAGRPADPAATPPAEAIQGKQALYVEARAVRAARYADLQAARKAAREYLAQAKDFLRKALGRRWSPEWMAVGFTQGSLEIPTDTLPALGALAAYLRAHPAREISAVDFTAVKAEEARAALVSAQALADLARVNLSAAKQARDLAQKDLREQLSSLRTELASLLSADDSRWYAFGFRRPVDGETPDLIEEVRLTPAGPGQVLVDWDHSRLADSYRVKWRITETSEAPTDAGIGSDPQRLLQNLPIGQGVTVLVTARNASGESAPMEASILVT